MKFKSLTKGATKEMERNTGVAGSKTSPKNAVTAEHDYNRSIDVVHRLGRYSETQKKPRLVIIRFVTRSARDLIWRKAKNCSFLKENYMRFTEDLSSADRAIREKLWPLIDAARKEGKRAHFAGVRVIIEGKEVHPTLTSPEDQAAPALWRFHALLEV